MGDVARIAVKLRILKEFAGASEVENGEERFSGVFPQACAAADDLLKFRHRRDVLIKDDKFHAFRVGARREKFRRGDDDGVVLFDARKVFVEVFAFLVVRRHAHDVIGIHLAEFGVVPTQRIAHRKCVALRVAEDDGFRHRPQVLQVGRHHLRHFVGAVFEFDRRAEVFERIKALRDELSRFIRFPVLRFPAVFVFVQTHGHHLERRQKAVVDPLFQRIGVDRFAEVVEVVGAFFFVGRRCQAQVNGGLEVIKYGAPATFFTGASPVAFVHDDEIEIVARDFFVVVGDDGVVFARVVAVPL